MKILLIKQANQIWRQFTNQAKDEYYYLHETDMSTNDIKARALKNITKGISRLALN